MNILKERENAEEKGEEKEKSPLVTVLCGWGIRRKSNDQEKLLNIFLFGGLEKIDFPFVIWNIMFREMEL